MNLRYQVFIQGTNEPGQAALMRAATAIGARYGLPAADMAQRMSAGRFRVKTNIDLATAERLADDLESMGARCVVVDEAGQVHARGGAAAAPAAGNPVQGGLSAAQVDTAAQDLGVLGDGSAPLSLATLDGEEEAPPSEQKQSVQSFAPSDFAPPAAEAQELVLAVDVHKPPARPAAAPGMAGDPAGGAPQGGTMAPLPAQSGPTMPRQGTLPLPPSEIPGNAARAVTLPQAAGAPSKKMPSVNPGELFEKMRSKLADSAILRLAVGLYAALLIGFLPAHLLASVREGSAYGEVDAELKVEQSRVTDVEGWEALDEFRSAQLERKHSKRTNIAMGSLLLWALTGGGLAFLWFRKIDWDQYKSFR